MARQGLFQANIENRGMPLDPRTKLLLITVMTFVLGGAGGENMTLVVHALCVIPFLLHLSAKNTAQHCFIWFSTALPMRHIFM